MEDQIKKQENFCQELEKKSQEIHELAKSQLKEGNKNKAKSLLIAKKKYIDKIKGIEGIMALIEEERFILEETRGFQEIATTIKNGIKIVQEANKNLSNNEAFKLLQEDMTNAKDAEMRDFLKEDKSEEDDNLQKSEEGKIEEKKRIKMLKKNKKIKMKKRKKKKIIRKENKILMTMRKNLLSINKKDLKFYKMVFYQ